MSGSKRSIGCRTVLGIGVVLSVAVVGFADGRPLFAESAGSADDGRGILRHEVVEKKSEIEGVTVQEIELVPVPPEELKPGYIYSHFSQQLNRRVWSFFRPDAGFWYALGAGTTQEARLLDIRASEDEQIAAIRQVAPGLAYAILKGRQKAFARLNENNRWELAKVASHSTVYSQETGRRWDWVSGKYLPVRHTHGYRWAIRGGDYVPAGRLHAAMRPADR
jgi:hypothetical protein